MIPRRFEPLLFALVLSGQMSLILSGISAAVMNGLGSGFVVLWLKSWTTGWVLAFLIVLVVGPFTRKVVRRMLRAE